MIFNLMGMVLLDAGVVAIFNSPFIIPVAGCVMILGMSVGSMWAKVRSEEIKSHERLAKIAQGIPLEPTWEEATVKAAAVGAPAPAIVTSRGKINDGSGARRAGIVLVSIGVGLFLFFLALTVILRVPPVLSGGAAGLIPFAIGVGFLVDARHKRRDFEYYMQRGWLGGVVPSQDVQGQPAAPPPPPPPPGMSAAQASDWRPLH